MVVENKYLRKAVEKAGCVVMVKSCHLTERKGRLDYISPNASMLGMNVALLNKGLKLTEDYIFPADRDRVMKTLLNAVEDGVKDYVHEYRMVGDDGQVYYVTNQICLSDIKGETITVESYLTKKPGEDSEESPEGKKIVRGNRGQKHADKDNVEDDDIVKYGNIGTMMEVFAKLSGLYSVYVNLEGKIVFLPNGPAADLGNFYDLFENPAYKEYYQYIKQVVTERNAPVILDREEGGTGKIAAAPICMKNEILGFWMLGSYTEDETEKLKQIYEDQWAIAEIISEYLYKSKIAEIETAKSKGAGMKLREELARQNIVNEALNKINSKLIDSADEVIDETLRDVGLHLDIEKIILYNIEWSEKNFYSMRNYWDVSGIAPDEELVETLPERMYIVEDAINHGDGRYMVDSTNMTETSKLDLMRYNFKAVIAYPLYLNDRFYGILFFAECKSERVWTKEELRFTQSISLVIQNMLENAEGDDNIRNVNKHLIETYNSFKEGIFIRDMQSGHVLFSNTAMNDMLGYDFTNRDSRELLTDLHDRFDNITGMRKPFITKNRVANWRRYIQKLDDIMDITEIQIEWLKGERASLIILRKAKDN